MSNPEIIELDIDLWEGWTLDAADVSPSGFTLVFFRKGEDLHAGKLFPEPPRFQFPEEMGEVAPEVEKTLLKKVITEITREVRERQISCMRLMHENIAALVIQAAQDKSPALMQHIHEVFRTLYKDNPEVLGYMALSTEYPVSVRAVPARLFGEFSRMDQERDAILLAQLLAQADPVVKAAVLSGITSGSKN